MKTCPLRLLAVVILFCTSIPIPAQSQLPEPDPSTMAGQSPEQLLRLSFVGINRANIRAYLAQYHPDTPEGTFSKAWMLDNQRKFPEAVETYTRVVDDSSASPGLRSVAAGNRAASATAGDMPDTNQWIEKSIQAVFELKQLPHGALRNMSTEYRPLWEEMYRQHPQLIAANPAAHLLNEARYYRRAEKGDHPQTRKLIEELLELGPAQWGPDFDVDILLDLLTSPSVFPDMKPEERLTRNDLLPRLYQFIATTTNEESDPVRRAEVASWGIGFSKKLLAADTRHSRYAGLAGQLVLSRGWDGGAIPLYPSGNALEMLRTLWDGVKDGNQLSDADNTTAFLPLEEMADATRNFEAPSDAKWQAERAILLARNGRHTEARSAFQAAARGSFHPDQLAEVLYLYANECAGPMDFDTRAVQSQLESLLDKTTPIGRRSVTANLASLAFRSGDIPAARRWLEQFQNEFEASPEYADERLTVLKQAETSLRQREQFTKSNPLETQWQSQHGQQGISVQLNFPTNSHQLPTDTATKLAPILTVLDDPTYQNLAFRLEGHTDDTGSDAINNPLSFKRAESLATFLEHQYGITRGRLEMDGFGSRRPIASNLSESGRTLNRRVELNLMGDLGRPTLVTTGAMDNGISTVSPDGRLLVSFNGDVWDTRDWVRLYTIRYDWNLGGVNFSPDGRYLAVAVDKHSFSTVLLFDARTGVLSTIVPTHGEPSAFAPAWSPDSKKLAFTTGTWSMVYDIDQQKITHSAQVPGSRGTSYFCSWVKGGKSLAVQAQAGRKRLYVIDIESSKIEEKRVGQLSWSHSMNASYDARYLYITDDGGGVFNWDTLSDDPEPSLHPALLQELQTGKQFAGKRISVHPGQPQTIAVEGVHRDRYYWGIINFADGTVKSDQAKGYSRVFWGPDAQSLLLSGGWVANPDSAAAGAGSETGIYQLALGENTEVSNNRLQFIKGPSAKLFGLLAFESHDMVAAFSKGNISIWDITTGRQMHQWTDTAALFAGASKEHPGTFYAVLENPDTKESRLIHYDLNQFRRQEIATLDNFKITSFSPGGNAVLLGGGPFMESKQAADNLELRLLDSTSGQVLNSKSVEVLTEPLQQGEMQSSAFVSVRLSPAGDEAAFVTKWSDGYVGHGMKKSKLVRLWDITTGELKKPIATDWTAGIDSIDYETDGKLRLARFSHGNDSIFDIQQEEWVSPGQPIKSRPNHTCATDLETAFQASNLQIEFSSSGEIRFLRRDTGDTVITILKKGDDWIASNADGYFVASPGGTGKVFWRVGSRMLPLEALRGKFENPALLADSLKAIFEKRIVDRPVNDKPIISPDLFNVPYQLEILTPSGTTTKADKYLVKVQVTALTPDAEAPQFVWTANGRTSRGFDVVPSNPTPQVHIAENEFALIEGSNELSVAIRYKDAIILRQSITVHRSVPTTPSIATSGSHLWFFGVGVKDYAKPDQNLDYPDRDVDELAKMLESQKGILYKEVNTRVLTNADATVRNIKIEMNRFLKQASSQDLIIIFLAGHGVVGSDQELYYVAHDSIASPAEAYTGLELRDFAEFLERRPPTQKAIFLMDICHAGSFGQTSKQRGGGLTSEDAIKMMEEGTGTVVLASSTGREASWEDSKWRGGHGAFTAALLDGLEGQADAAEGDSDGYISLLELASFVSRQVPRMTDGLQHPTMPKMENVRDFPISKVR